MDIHLQAKYRRGMPVLLGVPTLAAFPRYQDTPAPSSPCGWLWWADPSTKGCLMQTKIKLNNFKSKQPLRRKRSAISEKLSFINWSHSPGSQEGLSSEWATHNFQLRQHQQPALSLIIEMLSSYEIHKFCESRRIYGRCPLVFTMHLSFHQSFPAVWVLFHLCMASGVPTWMGWFGHGYPYWFDMP